MPNYPIVHFEIPVDDLQRAKAFYNKTFGWKIDEWKSPSGWEYYMVYTKNDKEGINGGMMKRMNSQQPVVNYVMVESIDDMIRIAKKNGGTLCMPKKEIAPGMGWVAIVTDTEGNQMGLHESPPKPVAKPAVKKTAKKTAKKAVRKTAKKKR